MPTFLKGTAYVTALGWSFFVFVGIFAEPVLILLYGPQWTGSVGLTRLISLGLFFGLPSVFVSVALTSTGQVNLLSRLTVTVVIQFIISMAVGAWFGLAAIGWAYAISTTINAVVWLIAGSKAIGFGIRTLMGVLSRSAAVTATTAIPPLAVFLLVPAAPWHGHLQLAVAVPLTALAFIASVLGWKHPLALEVQRITARWRPVPTNTT